VPAQSWFLFVLVLGLQAIISLALLLPDLALSHSPISFLHHIHTHPIHSISIIPFNTVKMSRQQSPLLLLLLLQALALCTLFWAVSADPSDCDSRRRDVFINNERGSTTLTLQSVLSEGRVRNAISYQISLDSDDVRFQVQYERRVNFSAIELDFTVRFNDLIEFVANVSNTSGFQPNQDRQFRIISLGRWEPFVESGPDANNVTTFTAKTASGLAAVSVKVSQTPFQLTFAGQNLTVFPNTVKFEFVLNLTNYVYQSNHSMLAFRAQIESDSESEFEFDAVDSFKLMNERPFYWRSQTLHIGNVTSQSAVLGVFNWAPVVEADGNVTNLILTQSPSCSDTDGYRNCFTTFLTVNATNPRVVVWDPVVGAGTADVDSNTEQITVHSSSASHLMMVSLTIAMISMMSYLFALRL